MQKPQPNVFYDSASAHAWSDLNETVFLERVLAELRATMGGAFLDYSFFILSAHDGDVWPDSASDPAPRKVLIFISDESASVPAQLQPHYLAIFKSYLPRELPGSNLLPFSVGYVRDVEAHPPKPIEERKLNVFFSGNLSPSRLPLYRAIHPVYRRLPALAFRMAFALEARGYCPWLLPRDLSRTWPSSMVQFSAGFQQGLSRAEYSRCLVDSRIALCPMGAKNPETFRHIEAMRAGAVLVSEPLPDTQFYRGAPIVTVDDWTAGRRRVVRLLQDVAALKDLQRDTLRWWDDVCSEAATARYMHDRLTELTAAESENPRRECPDSGQ